MVGIGSGFHLHFPGKSMQRILHPAKVVGLQDDTYTAEVEEQSLGVESGQDVLVYFEKNREFMQQSAQIESVGESEEGQIITLTTTGEPVSAESRKRYRAVGTDGDGRFPPAREIPRCPAESLCTGASEPSVCGGA